MNYRNLIAIAVLLLSTSHYALASNTDPCTDMDLWHAIHPTPEDEDSSDDGTFDLSPEFLSKVFSPPASPTELVSSESVPPAPKTPVPTEAELPLVSQSQGESVPSLAALPAVFQPVVAAPATVAKLPTVFQPVVASPATVIELSSPLEYVSPNRTAGEKRKRVPASVAMPIPLAKKLSSLFDGE